MMRRLILAALAMLAILSLASCGMSRSFAPQALKPQPVPQVQPQTGGADQGGDEQPIAGRH
jgi:energy-converting hydrogenase Eha subunit F